jgi:serine protease Do
VIADLVDKVKPAVVAIKVSIKTALDSDETGQADIPKGSPLERFFKRFGDQSAEDGESEMPHKGRQQVQAQGSGFFISADGFIVTNNHVVDKAIKVSVVLEDGRTLDAKIIGRDAKTDLALLKVEAPGPYPFVPLAGAAPRVGENVIAIGNPYGLGGTVTSGIVSARGRDIGSGPYDDFIQIDAAVNRGNSGGPTFNLQGEVVGVNTAIYSPTGGSIGLGFAVPSRTVLQVVEQIKQHGSVERGYLGVRTQSVTQELAEGLGLTEVKGALVDHAEKGTPAAKAGLKAGDVIVAVNSELITDVLGRAAHSCGCAISQNREG